MPRAADRKHGRPPRHRHVSKNPGRPHERDDDGRSSLSADASTAIGYQTLVQTQTMAYHELDVPEAKFSYDLSPMAVAVRTTGKRWYDFVTSICAIVGGTFTTVGLIDAVAHKVLKAGKQL